MQVTNSTFTGLQTSDIITIITTLAIVAANSAVTLYIYFHSRRPNFSLTRFHETGDVKIRMHDVDKPIPRCRIVIDGKKMVWDTAFHSHEKYIPAGGGGVITINDENGLPAESEICVFSGKKKLRCMRASEIDYQPS